MELFVYGTLRPGTAWYRDLVKKYVDEEKTREGTLSYTNVGGGAIFQFGGVNLLPGVYYTISEDADVAEMIAGLDDHESSPNHFRLINMGNDLIVYEWNFETRGYSCEQVLDKVEAEARGEYVT